MRKLPDLLLSPVLTLKMLSILSHLSGPGVEDPQAEFLQDTETGMVFHKPTYQLHSEDKQ